jgi:hypothetical protein
MRGKDERESRGTGDGAEEKMKKKNTFLLLILSYN